MTAFFIVRTQVLDPMIEDAFDRWYGEEHLPDAARAFGARRAWRGWSDSDASVHYAFYEFDDAERARSITGSEALAKLVTEFDRAWGGKVRRSRDIVEAVQTVGAR